MSANDFVELKTQRMGRVVLLLAVMFLCATVKGFAVEPPGIPDGWSQRFAYVNGVRINYYQAVAAPDKPVMVMVHGVTDNGLCWATLAMELQEDYNIYMLDTRGHGLSDPFTTSDNEETLIKDVLGFLEVMNIKQPILVGHSMGAATVMRLGADYPDVAQRIIMLDPFLARVPRPGGARPAEASVQQRRERSEQAAAKNLSINMFGNPEMLVKQNNYAFEDLVEKGKRDHPQWSTLDVQYWALSKKQYHGAYVEEGQSAMSGNMQVGDALSRISVPAMVLKADAPSEARKLNEEAVKNLDRVKLVHIDGTGHNLHHDDLERTVQEITGFLAE